MSGLEQQAQRWETKAEWLDETRRAPRWCDVRTALAKFGGDEYLGKVRDLSIGGLGLEVNDAQAAPGLDIAVCVVFDDRVVEMNGRVAYSLPREWGSRVGVSVPELSAETRDYLTRRYAGSAGEQAVS